jgi:hypothetical protein
MVAVLTWVMTLTMMVEGRLTLFFPLGVLLKLGSFRHDNEFVVCTETITAG